jgi:hypothetical protein
VNRQGIRGDIKAAFLEPWLEWKEGKISTGGGWVFQNTRMVEMSQNRGPVMTFRAVEFIPVEGERLSYSWRTGEQKKLFDWKFPPFAIWEFPSAKDEILNVINKNALCYLQIMLADSNDFVKELFQLAYQKVDSSEEVGNTYCSQK